jgi:ribosomal protein S12 methylthiotransferase
VFKKYIWQWSIDGSTASGKDVEHEAPANENIIVINTCGFIDNAKAESVNMILEYADKRKRTCR